MDDVGLIISFILEIFLSINMRPLQMCLDHIDCEIVWNFPYFAGWLPRSMKYIKYYGGRDVIINNASLIVTIRLKSLCRFWSEDKPHRNLKIVNSCQVLPLARKMDQGLFSLKQSFLNVTYIGIKRCTQTFNVLLLSLSGNTKMSIAF